MVVKRGSRVPLTAAGTDGPREPYCSHVLSHAGCRRGSVGPRVLLPRRHEVLVRT